MQFPGITEGISKHLSSLRMNSTSGRRKSTSFTLHNVPLESPLDDTAVENIGTYEGISFDPLDPSSYPTDCISTGINMIRVTRRKRVKRSFKLNLPSLTLTWNSKSNSKVEIQKIQSIRVGNDAKNYREEFNVSKEFTNLWITVIYVTSSSSSSSSSMLFNDLKSLHMIAPTNRNFNLMLNMLTLLSKWSKDQESLINCANLNEFSTIKWNNKVKNLDRQYLSFEDILKLTQELHIFMNSSYLKSYFMQCDTNCNNYLNFEQFKKFVSKLRQRHEFEIIFLELGIKNNKMLKGDFTRFIKHIQKEFEFDDLLIGSLFDKYSFENNGIFMNQQNLSDFLNSSISKPLIDEQDLHADYYDYSLTDYFISSSHNTYLLGKQVHGYSSIEGYIHALQRGCRCIEIDVWDNPGGNDLNPIVTHGRTLTNSIDFKLVIDIIRKYAFISSPYPLIISLEIKCSKESQLKCVSFMKSIFDKMLLTLPLNDESVLPSPNELKHKILIKVKKSNLTTIIEPNLNSIYSSFSTASSTQSDDFLNPIYSGSSTNDESTAASSISSFKKIVPKSKGKTFVVPELTILAPYLVGTKFRNFSLPESKTFNHVFSFSDRSLVSLLKDKTKLLPILKHNRRGIMRVYPSVVRYKSDNFNPIKFWDLGCQMVATNWQIWDNGEEIGESFFKSIGSDFGFSGYRLKPKSLRKDIEIENTNNDDKELTKKKILNSLNYNIEKSLEIFIISGQQLPKPKDTSNDIFFTPWVEVEIYNIEPKDGEIVHIKHSKPSTIDKYIGNTIDNKEDGRYYSENNRYYNDREVGEEAEEEKERQEDEDNYDKENTVKEINDADENSSIDDVKYFKCTGSLKINQNDRTTSSHFNPNVIFKTRVAENLNNLFNPRWNISCRLNYSVNENDLSFLRIIIKTKTTKLKTNKVINKVGNAVVKSLNDYVIGTWCCKISDLKEGYRQIRIGDNKGDELIYSSLFIKVTKG